MPTSYAECYQHLKEAQAGMEALATIRERQERYAALRVAFFHLYQATNIACMCCEASGFPDMASHARIELGDFLDASRRCHELVDLQNGELEETCELWLERAKGYVEKTRAAESRVTNLQYARMPEKQDYSIICKDGANWRGIDNE